MANTLTMTGITLLPGHPLWRIVSGSGTHRLVMQYAFDSGERRALMVAGNAEIGDEGSLREALDSVVANGWEEILEAINQQARECSVMLWGTKAIEMAAYNGNASIISLLMKLDHVCFERSDLGYALRLATRQGHREAMKALRALGATLDDDWVPE